VERSFPESAVETVPVASEKFNWQLSEQGLWLCCPSPVDTKAGMLCFGNLQA